LEDRQGLEGTVYKHVLDTRKAAVEVLLASLDETKGIYDFLVPN
jgi:hypothetical protein